eukprot:GHUV01000025.1.p2 GENE.GHUV01000025.1~~GHUV01000025.1.p2  ORF type:complete len:136 (+),score=48.36 GHUV01000025.1:182-589(+)
MALAFKSSAVAKAGAVRPGRSVSRTPLVVRARDNPYHDRDHQKSKNPGGTKDANAVRQDKEDQYEYQQERLEWRRKNQQGGDAYEDRVEPPVTNQAKEYSAEKRGPEVRDTGNHGDTLKDLVDNITGKKKKEGKH